MNRLILESDNPDPKVRLRAVELLGKMNEVSLFSENANVVVTHQTADDVRQALKGKLQAMMSGQVVSDQIAEEVDRELGLVRPVTIEQEDEPVVRPLP